ncbi:hypothetical protein Ancab_034433 [Ancistrocladus abbreviatus]
MTYPELARTKEQPHPAEYKDKVLICLSGQNLRRLNAAARFLSKLYGSGVFPPQAKLTNLRPSSASQPIRHHMTAELVTSHIFEIVFVALLPLYRSSHGQSGSNAPMVTSSTQIPFLAKLERVGDWALESLLRDWWAIPLCLGSSSMLNVLGTTKTVNISFDLA